MWTTLRSLELRGAFATWFSGSRDIKVGEFEVQSRKYLQFRINTIDKGMNSLIQPQAIG